MPLNNWTCKIIYFYCQYDTLFTTMYRFYSSLFPHKKQQVTKKLIQVVFGCLTRISDAETQGAYHHEAPIPFR